MEYWSVYAGEIEVASERNLIGRVSQLQVCCSFDRAGCKIEMI